MSLAILYFQTKLPHIRVMVITAEKKEGLTPLALRLLGLNSAELENIRSPTNLSGYDTTPFVM